MFSRVCDIFNPKGQEALRVFNPLLNIEGDGRRHCNIRIANEATLRSYQKTALESYVTDIISQLSEMQDSHEYELGEGIAFENDTNTLSDMAEEVEERLHIQPPRTPPLATQQFDFPNHEILFP